MNRQQERLNEVLAISAAFQQAHPDQFRMTPTGRWLHRDRHGNWVNRGARIAALLAVHAFASTEQQRALVHTNWGMSQVLTAIGQDLHEQAVNPP